MISPSTLEGGARPDKRDHDEMTQSQSPVENTNMSPDRPKKKAKTRFSQSGIVTIIAGKDETQEEFEVHKDTICKKSKIFTGCLQHEFEEAASKRIQLPDDEPIAVCTFIEWVYTGPINLDDMPLPKLPSIYAFADKVCAEEYCNTLLDSTRAFLRKKNMYLNVGPLKELYRRNLRHKQLTSFAIEDMVHTIIAQTKVNSSTGKDLRLRAVHQENLTEISDVPELAEDVMKLFLSFHTQPFSRPDSREGCCYHEHTEGTSCSPKEGEGKAGSTKLRRGAW